jgi:demethylmenaquinone methyltransferase/2-methoxy-6-polyprenyl-1,4-benzoquinol methylase
VHETQLLTAQRSYYRARAPEYDAWWERRGRYDRGRDANSRWFVEAAHLERALARSRPRGDILELACGTGLWTRILAPHARSLTAVDAAPEMIAQNQSRLGGAAVQYVEADLFDWQPKPDAYDLCFFAFWLSHVPESRFDAFWKMVATALRPGGRVFFIDSDRSDRSSASDHRLPPADEETILRRLDDGREFCIVKRFYAPRWLERRLADLGWRIQVRRTGEFFIYGTGERTARVRRHVRCVRRPTRGSS